MKVLLLTNPAQRAETTQPPKWTAHYGTDQVTAKSSAASNTYSTERRETPKEKEKGLCHGCPAIHRAVPGKGPWAGLESVYNRDMHKLEQAGCKLKLTPEQANSTDES